MYSYLLDDNCTVLRIGDYVTRQLQDPEEPLMLGVPVFLDPELTPHNVISEIMPMAAKQYTFVRENEVWEYDSDDICIDPFD